MMTPNEFTDLLDVYGADLSRWPQDKIQPALAVMAADKKMQRAFNAVLASENLLRQHQPALPDMAALENRIMAAVSALPAAETAAVRVRQGVSIFNWRPAYIFAPSGGLLAAALIGFVIGMQPAPQQEYMLDAMYVSAAQVVADDDLYERGVF